MEENNKIVSLHKHNTCVIIRFLWNTSESVNTLLPLLSLILNKIGYMYHVDMCFLICFAS